MNVPAPNPKAAYREAPIRIKAYRVIIAAVAAFLLNGVVNGQRPVMGIILIVILVLAFYFRRRQFIWVYENEIIFQLGIPFRVKDRIEPMQHFSLENISKINVLKRKSVFLSPAKKMIEIRYKDGNSMVLNCTLFSKEDFEEIEAIVRKHCPVEEDSEAYV